ncbi:hypothetical protein [Rhizobium sp. RU36D]|uniref:hypothetical protein n=1 Tax=Rhizobium sp. RU36D TaxID=1907415 RepID=UPI0009D8A6C1|nr:hypothetical protein [Rhizobium sp. RU36D]SMC56830.1 hypothetical protein SAMN05880593_10318 [Rhizobium sp. RU36D]
MNKFAAATLIAVLAGSSAAFALEPIPGSLTYGGANVQLQKAPAGSSFEHAFITSTGDRAIETYRVNADKTVTLVTRDHSESN